MRADIGAKCAGDLDDVQKLMIVVILAHKVLKIMHSILIDAVTVSITDEFEDWKNYLYLIIIGIGLRQLDYPYVLCCCYIFSI